MGRMPAMPQSLLDVVAGEFLTEGGGGAILVLGLVEHGNSGVQRSADDEVLLPGDLVGRVSLRLGAGAEADARDAVAALDGNAVGGEGPLVGQRAAFALSLAVSSAHSLVSPHSAWCASTSAWTCGAEALLIQVGKKHSVS